MLFCLVVQKISYVKEDTKSTYSTNAHAWKIPHLQDNELGCGHLLWRRWRRALSNLIVKLNLLQSTLTPTYECIQHTSDVNFVRQCPVLQYQSTRFSLDSGLVSLWVPFSVWHYIGWITDWRPACKNSQQCYYLQTVLFWNKWREKDRLTPAGAYETWPLKRSVYTQGRIYGRGEGAIAPPRRLLVKKSQRQADQK